MTMKLSKITLAIGCFVLFSFLFFSPATSYSETIEIQIDVSPNVLNIQSEGTVVTVHTNISYSRVDAPSVTLNDIAISWWKDDNRGNFVAKFSMDEVKLLELEPGGYNTFELVGFTTGGEKFWGEQEIVVIDVLPRGE
jgi:hypothetical protein